MHDDTLEDLFNAAAAASYTPARAITPPAPYKPSEFTETCGKCNGTGQFRGYTGRTLGPCFACKGNGSKSFKTSANDRGSNPPIAKRQRRKRSHPSTRRKWLG